MTPDRAAALIRDARERLARAHGLRQGYREQARDMTRQIREIERVLAERMAEQSTTQMEGK